MTLSNQEISDIVNALLDHAGVPIHERVRRLRDFSAGAASLSAFRYIVDRYLAITNRPRTCQVEHSHWEGPMICGHTLPCPHHGGR